ncbi:hypothetical protein AGMMS49992_20450 [Clostridia bacterium]|nr:hypothetical protein AGMMS49992_20450 [Clostridia bacterium]
MNTTPIRIGIFGAENSHAAAFCKMFNDPAQADLFPGFKVTAIGGEDRNAVNKLTDEWDIPIVAAHTSGMVGKIDAAMITSRNGALHLGYAKPIIEAGLPLFIDKPITNDAVEARMIIDLAKKHAVPIVGGSSVKLTQGVKGAADYARQLGNAVLGGVVYAPVSMENEYGGFYFYSAHLVETALAVFGFDPVSVTAHKNEHGVSCILHYPVYDVQLVFMQGMYHYGVTVYDAKSGAKHFAISLDDCYECEARNFESAVKCGLMHASYEELIQNVYVLNAIHDSYTSGKPQHISSVARTDSLKVKTFANRLSMGEAAAHDTAAALRDALAAKDEINVVFAAAPSQNEFLAALVKQDGIDWQRINAFHMDEYVGLPADTPQRFGNFLNEAIFSKVPFKSIHYINGQADPDMEAARYSKLLETFPTNIVCMGVGENGHIAFNDPPVADFNDLLLVKRVQLEHACRMQQVHDGCFAALDDVPTHALTLTVPALVRGKQLFCVVPGERKSSAVKAMLTGPINEACPASILRSHPCAALYIDADSAGR